MAAKAQVIRLTKAEIIEQRDMQLRGEALGMAFQFVGARPSYDFDDMLRSADKVYAFLKDRKVPAEPAIELAQAADKSAVRSLSPRAAQ